MFWTGEKESARPYMRQTQTLLARSGAAWEPERVIITKLIRPISSVITDVSSMAPLDIEIWSCTAH